MTHVLGLRRQVAVILAIVILCVVGFIYLFARAGGHLPDPSAYRVAFDSTDIKNLQDAGDVRIAGVKVGTVYSRQLVDGHVHVVMQLDSDAVPLHQGATVRIGIKSVIGESMVVLKDGSGNVIPNDATLPPSAVVKPVDVDEIISTFDPKTRAALAAALTNSGVVTDGTGQSFSQLMDGIGRLGREGYTAADALAAQSGDFKALAVQVTDILNSLDTNRAALASLVDQANTLTQATANQKQNLALTVERLPALMTSARTATASLGGLATDLTPVANELDAAAPTLNQALTQLPSVTHSLRALLPYMNSSFGEAHLTLDKVPALATNLSSVAPNLDTLLRNLNPMLEYMKPYSFDIGSFFGNFGGAFDIPVENGVQPARLAPVFSEGSLRNNPLNLMTLNPLHYNNPYPSPMTADNFHRFTGQYPHVAEEQ
jgi:phospholipid/cholesterol/gamma-HCH transport system substrate-binding protein